MLVNGLLLSVVATLIDAQLRTSPKSEWWRVTGGQIAQETVEGRRGGSRKAESKWRTLWRSLPEMSRRRVGYRANPCTTEFGNASVSSTNGIYERTEQWRKKADKEHRTYPCLWTRGLEHIGQLLRMTQQLQTWKVSRRGKHLSTFAACGLAMEEACIRWPSSSPNASAGLDSMKLESMHFFGETIQSNTRIKWPHGKTHTVHNPGHSRMDNHVTAKDLDTGCCFVDTIAGRAAGRADVLSGQVSSVQAISGMAWQVRICVIEVNLAAISSQPQCVDLKADAIHAVEKRSC